MPESLLHPATFWFAVGLLLLCAEMLSPAFLLFFFGIGGLLTGLLCLLASPSFNQQLLLFCASSILMLLTLRRFLKPLFTGTSNSAPDSTELNGKLATVTEPITPPLPGKVELHGTSWRACAAAPIPAGATVRILARDNMTLSVETIST